MPDDKRNDAAKPPVVKSERYWQGWHTMRAGGMRMLCPFDRRRKAGREWMQGWHDAAKTYWEDVINVR